MDTTAFGSLKKKSRTERELKIGWRAVSILNHNPTVRYLSGDLEATAKMRTLHASAHR
jgi:hypothetical protein